MRVILFSLILILCGCATQTQVQIQKVEVPVPIPCNIIPPKKPPMAFTDSLNIDAPAGEPDLFGDVKRLLSEIQSRIGYEGELEVAIKSCNSK